VSKKVLVLLSHPFLASSITHRNLSSRLAEIENVSVRHIDNLPLKNGHFDAKTEQVLWDEVNTIVLEFPMYWYHSPASLKQYLDDVLTEDWAYQNAYALEGKNLVILTTTGGIESEYGETGEHGFPVSEVLTPYKSTAVFTKMRYLPELVIYAANFLPEAELEIQLVEVVNKIRALTK
jgi:putative NADPH-quinone reductase